MTVLKSARKLRTRPKAIFINIFLICWALLTGTLCCVLGKLSVIENKISDVRRDETCSYIFAFGISGLAILFFFAILFRYRLLKRKSFIDKIFVVVALALICPAFLTGWTSDEAFHGINAGITFIGILVILLWNVIVSSLETHRNFSIGSLIFCSGMVFSEISAISFMYLFRDIMQGDGTPIYEWCLILSMLIHLLCLTFYYLTFKKPQSSTHSRMYAI